MRLVILCLSLLCSLPLARAGTELPKLGKASEAWFGDNPYAADSSVHAYVIAQDIQIGFGFLSFGSDELSRRIEVRRIVRVLDPQGYGEALVKIRYYDPEDGGTGEQLGKVEAYTHQRVNGKVETQKVAKEERYRTRLSPEYVEIAFSFPGVVAGTVLDLSYSRESPSLRSCPITYFQDFIPVQVAETRLRAHEAFRYQTHVLGHERVEQTTDRKPYPDNAVGGNLIVTTFRAENLPAITPEPYITSLGNYRSHLRVELQTFAPPVGQTVEISGTWAKIVSSSARRPASRRPCGPRATTKPGPRPAPRRSPTPWTKPRGPSARWPRWCAGTTTTPPTPAASPVRSPARARATAPRSTPCC